MGEESTPSAQGEFSLDPDVRDTWWKNPSIDPHIQIYIYFLCTYEPSRLPFPNPSYGAYLASNFSFITTFSDNGSLSSITLNAVPYVANHLELGQHIFSLLSTLTPTTMVPALYQKRPSGSGSRPIPPMDAYLPTVPHQLPTDAYLISPSLAHELGLTCLGRNRWTEGKGKEKRRWKKKENKEQDTHLKPHLCNVNSKVMTNYYV